MPKRQRSEQTSRALTTNFLGHCDAEVLQAFVTAGVIVALADGRVAKAERDELVSYLDGLDLVPVMTRREIADAFDHRVRELEDRNSAEVIVQTFRPLAGLSLASVVVRAAERVAGADLQIHPREEHALKLIRLLLMTMPDERPHHERRGR
jgi:tellurite resistance protein